jgi:glycosyltransferase involved in cell wall biosynthesis
VYEGRRVAVVMPAYNVQSRVAEAVRTVPDFVDDVVVVDDASEDSTAQVLAGMSRPGLSVLTHGKNRGVGAAICSGAAHAMTRGAEVIAVMAGDGQMDPGDLASVLDPVARGAADYVKGNRFAHEDIWRVMPKSRLAGNMVLSVLTRVTSGYWHIFDSQCGYTAISAQALGAVRGRFYSRYGYPNDLLARLRAVNARVSEVPVRPVYDGQASGIRPRTVVYPILFVLLRSMARRLWQTHGRRLEDRPADQLLSSVPR